MHNCLCSHAAVSRYMQRLSGPFLDRIDIRLWIPPVSLYELQQINEENPTEQMKQRVLNARQIQHERYGDSAKTNAAMSSHEVRTHCLLCDNGKRLLETASKKFGLSARGYTRILKVARTIADLETCLEIKDEHLAEALSYRGLEIQQ